MGGELGFGTGSRQRRVGGDRAGQAGVPDDPPRGQHRVVDGLGERRVAEPDAVPVGHQHRGVDRFGERVGVSVGRPVDDGVEQGDSDPTATDGDDVEEAAGIGAEPGDTAEDRVAQCRWHVRLTALRCIEQLLDVEGVAVRAPVDVLDGGSRLGVPGPQRHQRCGVGAPERGDRDGVDRRQPPQLGGPLLQKWVRAGRSSRIVSTMTAGMSARFRMT